VTYQVGEVGEDASIDQLFETTGTLNNTVDHEPIRGGWPSFAFAHDLGDHHPSRVYHRTRKRPSRSILKRP